MQHRRPPSPWLRGRHRDGSLPFLGIGWQAWVKGATFSFVFGSAQAERFEAYSVIVNGWRRRGNAQGKTAELLRLKEKRTCAGSFAVHFHAASRYTA